MAEYILQDMAILVADYAGDEHPYEKDPERPETCSEYNQGWSDACDYIRFKLEGIPPDDAEPVRHGRWDDIPNAYMSIVSKTGTYHGNATTCSICLEVNPNAFKTNYCPNCGARMDGDAHAPD